MPVISIVMPVYNVKPYLEQCLESWLNQTCRDIEIICIDDASTDGSAELIQSWTLRDPRVKLHRLNGNKSAWVARKAGIEKAQGSYIMFADADDTISPEACQELLAEMERSPADILHFDSDVINVNGLPPSRIHYMKKNIRPFRGELRGRQVLIACFMEEKYRFTLWNKMYSAEICKRTLPYIKDAYLPKAQDKLLFFLIAFFAQSYRGIRGSNYYHYYYGRGGTGQKQLTLKQFERYCAMARTVEELHAFLTEQGCEAAYKEIEHKYRRQLFSDCYARWGEVREEDKQSAFELMLRCWSSEEIISSLAMQYRERQSEVLSLVQASPHFAFDRRHVRTIGTYYHSICNGGTQRVVSLLAALWSKMGYKVVLFTDEAPSETDYAVPVSVERVVLPNYQAIDAHNYSIRAEALKEALLEHNIDLMVYHAPICHLAFWDELVCKANHAAFVAHSHSVFSYRMANGQAFYSTEPYRLADAVAALSSADCAFWEHFCPNVIQTQNPFTDDGCCRKHGFNEDCRDILWVGRLSPEKNADHAVNIFQKVVKQVPDARLHIVGGGKSRKEIKYEKSIKRRIRKLGLSNSIIMHGFQADVMPFYNNAAVYLMTSSYEGFALTLLESKLAGIPTVMYELPYLTMCEGQRGIIAVPQGKAAEAADKLAELLLDADKRKALGEAARAHADEMAAFDQAGQWQAIFESVTREHGFQKNASDRLMMETLLKHYQVGMAKLKSRSIESRFLLLRTGKAFIRTVRTRGVKAALLQAKQCVRRALGKVKRKLYDTIPILKP